MAKNQNPQENKQEVEEWTETRSIWRIMPKQLRIVCVILSILYIISNYYNIIFLGLLAPFLLIGGRKGIAKDIFSMIPFAVSINFAALLDIISFSYNFIFIGVLIVSFIANSNTIASKVIDFHKFALITSIVTFYVIGKDLNGGLLYAIFEYRWSLALLQWTELLTYSSIVYGVFALINTSIFLYKVKKNNDQPNIVDMEDVEPVQKEEDESKISEKNTIKGYDAEKGVFSHKADPNVENLSNMSPMALKLEKYLRKNREDS